MVVRKRLIFWLIRAYINRWGKTFIFSFLAGLAIFFIVLFSSRYFINLIPVYNHTVTGLTGAYTVENLPANIMQKISMGLTAVGSDGKIKPGLAASWKILENGKTYVFYLKKNQYFSDGREITSDLINYKFADVAIRRPDKYTIEYKLKDKYAPFLITVSRPLFQPGLIGAGEYIIDDLKLNGTFVQSLSLANKKNRLDVITYEFYPSVEALKYAYVLGEVNHIIGVDNLKFKNSSYDKFPNSIVKKNTNYNKLVTLFYNNNDQYLSDKKMRLAISYTLPQVFESGEKAFLPYSPESIYFNRDLESKDQNFEHAKVLLDAVNTSSESAGTKISLSMKTLSKYKDTAKIIARNLNKLGIVTTIEEVEKVPADFQLYLGDFVLSNDPDQYPLWHSAQTRNITKYKNLRIDKLLEDGRKTVSIEERKKLYADFQKYLIEDSPASFLYFPYENEVIKKRFL